MCRLVSASNLKHVCSFREVRTLERSQRIKYFDKENSIKIFNGSWIN